MWEHWTLLSLNVWGQFIFWSQLIFSRTSAGLHSTEFRSLNFCLCAFSLKLCKWFLPTQCPQMLSSLSSTQFQLCFHSQERKCSLGSKLGAIIGLISFVSCLSGTTFLYCLMCIVLKIVVYYILPMVCFLGRNTLNNYSILTRIIPIVQMFCDLSQFIIMKVIEWGFKHIILAES